MNQTELRTMRNPSRWLQCPLNELERLELISGQPRTTLLWGIDPEASHFRGSATALSAWWKPSQI
ncbi:hypothetical protein ACFV8T_35180 [Streptomyces sp. NPDC059832]|uniref:hypothetical protein n=1 Tax=Streptomyces sp. NPDC059832 TaxID=3346966 RepID=UPI0036658E91